LSPLLSAISLDTPSNINLTHSAGANWAPHIHSIHSPELVEEEEEEEEDKDNFELELEETEAVHEAKRQRCKYHSEARLIPKALVKKLASSKRLTNI